MKKIRQSPHIARKIVEDEKIDIVHHIVIDLCAEHLAFPLSFVVAVVGIYVYAIIVNSISTQVRRIVEKIVIRKKKVKI